MGTTEGKNIVVGTNTRRAIFHGVPNGFADRNSEYTIFKDRGLGIRQAINRTKNGDIVAILGKGRENYQDIDNCKIYYSDIDIIEEYK